MSTQAVKKERKFVGIKDVILGTMLSLVIIVIFFTITPLVQPLGMQGASVVATIIPAFIGGPIYVLLSSKSPRTGIHLAFVFPWAVTFIISGSVITALLYIASGVVGELVMLGGWGKKWRPLLPYCIHWTAGVFGSTVPMVFFPESFIQTFMGTGMDEATATAFLESIIVIYTNPVFVTLSFLAAMAACVLGYYAGIKLLKKHFKGAGVV